MTFPVDTQPTEPDALILGIMVYSRVSASGGQWDVRGTWRPVGFHPTSTPGYCCRGRMRFTCSRHELQFFELSPWL